MSPTAIRVAVPKKG